MGELLFSPQSKFLFDIKMGNLFDVIKSNVDVTAADNAAIIIACTYNRVSIAEYLIDAGSDVCARDNAPIRLACELGFYDLVKVLVTAGADIRAQDDSAIRWATLYERFEVVKFLVSHGVPKALVSHNKRMLDYLNFSEKMEEKVRHRAANKIYFWIIPKLYAPGSESAQRLGLKGWQECFG